MTKTEREKHFITPNYEERLRKAKYDLAREREKAKGQKPKREVKVIRKGG